MDIVNVSKHMVHMSRDMLTESLNIVTVLLIVLKLLSPLVKCVLVIVTNHSKNIDYLGMATSSQDLSICSKYILICSQYSVTSLWIRLLSPGIC
jgi:hypothetical protein